MLRCFVLAVVLAVIPAGMPQVTAQEATPSADYAAPTSAPAHTAVHYVLPYVTDTLNPGLTVTETDSGACVSRSLASPSRPDAWLCIGAESGLLSDPCFENPLAIPEDPGDFACVVSPFAREVLLFTVTEPLPGAGPEDDIPVANNVQRGAGWDDGSRQPAPLPWVLDLANGDRCTLVSGAKALFAGMWVNYFCADGGFVFGDPDRSTALWKVNYVPPGAFTSDLVAVTDAWH
jgi:hypothetical protein